MTTEAKWAQRLQVDEWQIKNTLELYQQGATIPFIARYRKERTGGLTDVQLIELFKWVQQDAELEKRKKAILNSLDEQGVTDEALLRKIREADQMSQLEDLYLPYRPKRKTKASMAREKGLEPLAKLLMSERVHDFSQTVIRFVKPNMQAKDCEEALQGARDIMAEWISETEWVRHWLRRFFQREAKLRSKVMKGKEAEAEKYTTWFDWEEAARKAPSHRILALFRAEKEGMLRVKVQPSFDEAYEILSNRLVKSGPAQGPGTERCLKTVAFPCHGSRAQDHAKTKSGRNSHQSFW